MLPDHLVDGDCFRQCHEQVAFSITHTVNDNSNLFGGGCSVRAINVGIRTLFNLLVGKTLLAPVSAS